MAGKHSKISKTISLVFLAMSAVFSSDSVMAERFIPADGNAVVEHLKKDVHQRELQALRKEVNANPNDIELVSKLARRYIAESRNTGDPRYLGYAQATLGPWWKQVQAPVDILVLRATILQSTHQFSAALLDLNLVLKMDKDNPQAWLTKATIQQVTGDFNGAKNSCMRLYSLAPEIVTATCLNNIGSLNGDAEKSYVALTGIYKNTAKLEPSIKIWVLTLLAEIATRRGDAQAAQSWFSLAMAADAPDSYLLGAYADFLLDQNRDTEVVTLLKEKTRVDALLLRYTIALQKQNSPLAAESVNALEQRFNAAIMREDTVHQREHARFELQVKNRPAAALALAQKNWAIQKEPADLRIYLEAALAGNNPKAALPALEWLRENKLEDKVAQKLRVKLGGAV
jgi:Tfp pilus assembly protein PilF